MNLHYNYCSQRILQKDQLIIESTPINRKGKKTETDVAQRRPASDAIETCQVFKETGNTSEVGGGNSRAGFSRGTTANRFWKFYEKIHK